MTTTIGFINFNNYQKLEEEMEKLIKGEFFLFNVCGTKGSLAEQYAVKNGAPFFIVNSFEELLKTGNYFLINGNNKEIINKIKNAKKHGKVII